MAILIVDQVAWTAPPSSSSSSHIYYTKSHKHYQSSRLLHIYIRFVLNVLIQARSPVSSFSKDFPSPCTNTNTNTAAYMISNNARSIEPVRSKPGVLKKLKIATGLQSSSSSDTGRGRSKYYRGVAYGFSLVKGKANHPMEDYHFSEFRRMNNQEIGLFAIFDGHLSHNVPQYLQGNLFDNIVGQPEFWRNPRAATSKAYEVTDKVILQKAPELGTGGSTAVTAILMSDGRLLVANVGDSRAVLCRAGHALQLSVDHEPKQEKRIIERRGGFVTMLPGDVPRVDGQLAVARAFGDRNLKAHLSCDPDILEMVVDATDEFLILASDGLWKVMENQEAVDLIRKVKDPETAAKVLAEAALLRKSRNDISCIVVRLR